jgi:hypothetical protein
MVGQQPCTSPGGGTLSQDCCTLSGHSWTVPALLHRLHCTCTLYHFVNSCRVPWRFQLDSVCVSVCVCVGGGCHGHTPTWLQALGCHCTCIEPYAGILRLISGNAVTHQCREQCTCCCCTSALQEGEHSAASYRWRAPPQQRKRRGSGSVRHQATCAT